MAAGLAAQRPVQIDQEMRRIDGKIDGGHLDTGQFYRRGQGFIYTLAY